MVNVEKINDKPITETCILSKLRIGKWGGKIHDSEASREVEKANEAEENTVRVIKILMDFPEYKDFKTIGSKARSFHRDHTMPWLWGGTGILPMDLYDEYKNYMDDIILEAEEATKVISARYPERIKLNEKKLAKLFKGTEYPPVKVITGKFIIDYTFYPVGQSDFRSVEGLTDAQKVEFQARAEQQIKDDLEDSTKILFQRFHKYVHRMYERLENEDKTFRESLISNIEDVIEILPKINITNNAELNNLCKDAKLMLCKHDAEDLRMDLTVRSTVAKDAKVLSDAAALYFGGTEALDEKKAA